MTTTTLTPTDNHELLNGTSLVGYVDVSYADLVATFGEPNAPGDGYKVDAEWLFVTDDGEPVTVYNYKDGRNYCGDEGKDVADIRDWHVGGNSARAIEAVRNALFA